MLSLTPRSAGRWLLIILLGGLTSSEHRAMASDKGPTASFEIKNDDLVIRVNWDPFIPVPATMRVLLPDGTLWAEAETGDDGACAIPRPDSPYCKVEFKAAGVLSPPVTLTFLDGGTTVIPLVAPLEPGECCKEIRPGHGFSEAKAGSRKSVRSTSPGRLTANDLLLGLVMITFPLLLLVWDQLTHTKKGKNR